MLVIHVKQETTKVKHIGTHRGEHKREHKRESGNIGEFYAGGKRIAIL